MNRRLLFWMVTLLLTIGGVQNASAQASYNHSYTKGVVVQEGGDYFLYNIGAGQFLTGGMDWGSRASADHAGKVCTLAIINDGVYSIHTTYYSENGLSNPGFLATNENGDPYTDIGTNNANWTFTPVTVAGYTNAYTLQNGENFLYYDASDTRMRLGANTGDNYSYWIIVPRATRDAVGDYTYYIQNQGINRFWERACWAGCTWGNDKFATGGEASNPCGEKWHATVDFYQELSTALPSGDFKLYAQGFYAQDDNETETLPQLYANTTTTALAERQDGSINSMTLASQQFTAGNYVNELPFSYTSGDLRLGINVVGTHQWVIWDNFAIQRTGSTVATVATQLPANGDMAANTWYYYDVATTDLYAFTTTTFDDIVFVTDGTLDEYEANIPATNFTNAAGTSLTAGRYYIKSSSANSFAITNISPSNAAQMADLAAAITAAKAHTLGFDNGEYAPYNNVAHLQAIADAEAIDQNNPGNYTATAIADIITGLTSATWTANSGEVNGIFWKTDYVAADKQADGYIHPVGWTNTGYNTRVMCAAGGATNAGLNAVNNGIALFSKYNTTYGETTGYTLPLKANTYYKVAFKYCGWGNNPTTNVVLTGPNGTVQVIPGSFRPATNNGDSHAENWYEYTGVFKTGETAGDYVLALNKVETGQQQIAWGNMVLVRATTDDLSYTLAEGQMNVDIATAQQSAKEAFDADKSFENYAALNAAIDAAKASIAVYQQINTRLGLLTSENQRGGLSEEQVKAMLFYTKYSDGTLQNTGTYTSLDEVLPAYEQSIANYYATNAPEENDNLTAFIPNQGFEMGDLTGWTLPAGTSGGDGSKAVQTTSHGPSAASEGSYFYSSWWTGKPVEQTIAGLPNGTYRLTATLSSNDTGDLHTVFLYAGNTNKAVEVPANSFGTWQADASIDFVVTNGTITLGAVGGKQDNTFDKMNPWIFFNADDFRLTYLSAEATIAPALVSGPMNADIATAQTTAYNTWNADKSVANYNALVEAIAAAQASADKYVIINERLPKLDDQTDIDVSALATKYDNGEYVEADDVFDAYQEILNAYYTANPPAANADLTAFIINPSFEFGNTDGWDVAKGVDTGAKDANNGTYAFSNSDGYYVFNTWSNWNPEQFLWVFQDVKHLPNGTYELSAVWATEDGYRTVEFTAENVLPGNVVEGQQVTDTFRPVDIDTRATKATGLERSVTITVTDGTLRIGGHGYQFFKCDNFRLKFLGAGLVDPDLTQPMNRYEKEYYESARDAYNANPTPENLRKANEYRIMVENSIKAYAAAKVTLDHVQEMMTKTNVYTYDAFFTIDDLFCKYGFAGYYGFRTLEDDQAYELERMFFGTGIYRDHSNFSIPAVPFIASAWDCGYQDDKHKGYAYAQDGWVEGSDYYANTWSREGNDDGTNMLTPYLEYWLYGDQLLAPRTLTATVEGTPNATYTVKMFVRVRTNVKYVEGNDATKPKGMTIQIGNGQEFTPEWQYIDNEGSQYVLNNGRQLWVCNLWNNDPSNLPTGDADANGNFQIKFKIGTDSNITWLSMKDVFVNYETEIPAVEMAKLRQQIAYAKLHALGFDPDYYAPYTNVPQLIALHRAEQVEDAPKNVFLVRAVTKALKALNYSGDKAGDDDGSTVLAYDASTDQWNKNTEEMNAFYWTNDYTSADVEHIEWYDYEDNCITPTGWDLIGRDDGFNTGIKKLGINSGDDADGLKSVDGETVLYAKYETSYGEEPGYTVPLQKGVKYIMTFTYTYAGEGTCPETRVSLTVPEAGPTADDTATSGLEVTRFTPAENGVDDMSKWYMYRATFTPTYDNQETGELANYVITFDKDNYDPEPVMFGELTLVRYKSLDEEDEDYESSIDVIDGESRTTGYMYGGIENDPYKDIKFVGTDVKVTRSFNAGAYNTLVLPFKLSGSELKEALGSNFNGKVYYYTGATQTQPEVNGDLYQLNFEEREGGIFANVPVMIYSDGDNPVNNLNEELFKNMVTKPVKNGLKIDTETFDFVGTYGVIKIPKGASYIYSDNNFRKSTGKANLGPTRGYFYPQDVQDGLVGNAKLVGFSIDDVPTGIMAIEEDGEMHVTSGNIYSVDGRLVRQNATSLEGLPRGTYIVDGKKYMIK